MGSYLYAKLLSIYLHTTTIWMVVSRVQHESTRLGSCHPAHTSHVWYQATATSLCPHVSVRGASHVSMCGITGDLIIFGVSKHCQLFITWCSYSMSNWRWTNNGCDVTSLSVMFLLWWVNLDHIREWNKYILHQVKTS